jgi:polyisoprenoid-binding protein YceI
MTTPSGRAAGQLAGPASWQLDPAGSSVTFQHKTIWGLATVRGTFSKLSGTGAIAADGSASGRLVIEAASLDTKHGARDKHLRSADFFNADAHPQIVVDITGVTRDGGTSADVTGTLTAAGITRPLRLTATVSGASDQDITLTASGEFDRADFGMTWGKLGMIRGKASVTVVARFGREQQ